MSHVGAPATSRRIGHAVWLERRLFEVVGGWVPELDDDEAVVAAAAQSRHHGWRAEQLATLLSTYDATTPEEWTGPDHGDEDAVAAVAAATSTVDRLAGLHRSVVPRLLATYDDLLAYASPVADGPMVRLVGIVRADLAADLAAGEALLVRLAPSAGGATST